MSLRFPVQKFQVLPGNDLAEKHFAEFPVWSEHYDYEEIEEIESWGLDPQRVLQMFRENQPGDVHCVYTLLEANPFPPRMRIFIQAELEAANGQRLNGYVVNEDAYCLSVFSQGQEFIFSTSSILATDNKEQEEMLRASLGNPEGDLFPMRYETRFLSESGTPIQGIFTPPKR